MNISLTMIFLILANISLANDVVHTTSDCGKRRDFGVTYEDLGNIKLLSEYNFISGTKSPDYPSKGDDRKLRTDKSPKWLEAVGKLVSEQGNCTAELVSEEDGTHSRVAITNWHCVNKLLHSSDLIEKAALTFTSNSGEVIEAKVNSVFAHGRGFDRDYAILILEESIPASKIKPLAVSSENVLTLRASMEEYIIEGTFQETAAGFSSVVNDIGQKGKFLTYDDNCHSYDHSGKEMNDDINEEDKSNFHEAKNCYNYVGSSGGAYVVSYKEVYDGEIEESIYLHGIIGGTRENKIGNAIMVKALIFEDDLYDAFDTYNN